MQTETENPLTTLQVTRRRLFSYVGWGSFASFWLGTSIATIRFLFPRVWYEPAQRFDAGETGGLSSRRGEHSLAKRTTGVDDSQ
jgi:hypothetical protein